MTAPTWDDMRGTSFDSRDVIARLDDLTERYEDDPASLDEDERAEMVTLESVRDQAEGYTDWQHGAQFIPEDAFEDHARELADSIGAIDANAGWPTAYIDWKAAADALRSDYTAVEIEGTTYYVR